MVSSERAWEILHDMEWADLKRWGFTLYRTDYNPENEPRWARLVEIIEHKTFEDIFNKPFGTPAPKKPSQATQVRQELWQAFKTDFRSDKELYNGADIDKLRKMHLEEVQNEGVVLDEDGEEVERPTLRQALVFFVADEEVLTKGVDEGWVKVVDAKYTAEEYWVRPNHPRGLVQDYWGWWKMKVGISHDLWVELGVDREISNLVPGRREDNDAKVWDGDIFSE